MDSDIEELRTLRAGEKRMWLMVHKKEVEDYVDTHDDADCRRHFGITRHDVLSSLALRSDTERGNKVLTQQLTQTVRMVKLEDENARLRNELMLLRHDGANASSVQVEATAPNPLLDIRPILERFGVLGEVEECLV
jgi:hypothetical protein